MKRLRIFGKLFFSHSSIGLISILAVSFIFYIVLRNSLIDRALDQLSSINILKKQLVENYFYRSKLNLEALQVENKFSKIYHELKESDGVHDQQDVRDLENLCKLYDFSNIHVFSPDRRQLFSTDHLDYPAGLIAKIDSAISKDRRHITIVDASVHSSERRTLLFYYVPILEGDSLLGVVLVQENFQKIQDILLENTGMGNTGESYIVGHDFTLRSSSRFFPDSLPGMIKAEAEAAQRLSQGEEGQGIVNDYRGVAVLSAYRGIDNADLRWAILSEMDEEEAMEPILQLRNYLLLITLLIIILVFGITFVLSNAIVKPVLQLKSVILTLSKGIMPGRTPIQSTHDEIGEMADAMHQLTEGFERTAVFASDVGSGNFDAPFTKLSEHDILGQSLLRMRDELRTFHENELKSSRARAAALLEGQESERTRIIKELHDGVGQMLTGIRMQIDLLEGEDDRKTDIKKYINETIAEVKRISYHVMPQAIVDFGLDAALQGLCDSILKYSEVKIDFQYIRESSDVLEFEISIAVYRIVQEGLNNIIKHAAANYINLQLVERTDELYCVLEDDGKGFNKHGHSVPLGSGLTNIRERVSLLDGNLDINSSPGVGTVIEIHIPRTK